MGTHAWLPPLLATAGLWLGWSVLIGALAHRLPMGMLQEPARRPNGARRDAALQLYEQRLGIRRWKSVLPDAGNALPGGVLKASLARRDPEALARLRLETRRAEWVHWALWPAWIVTALWLPPVGVLINLLFATLFNLPCLLLQRYNRLRLDRTLQRHPRR
jgi:glycosyl-4,4'-diaponeurosporenoate acyltransferase